MREYICMRENSTIRMQDISIDNLVEKLDSIYDICDTSEIDKLDPLKLLIKVNKLLDSYCDEETYFDLVDFNKVEITNSEGKVISIYVS